MLNIFCTTVGRQTLKTALDSVAEQDLRGDVRVILAYDGPENPKIRAMWESYGFSGQLLFFENGPHRDWGHTPRNMILSTLSGGHVLHLDDDDILLPNTVSIIRRHITEHPRAIHFYRVHYNRGPCYWQAKRVEHWNIGAGNVVYPIDDVKLGQFGKTYDGDLIFIKEMISNNPTLRVRWNSEVIQLLRPHIWQHNKDLYRTAYVAQPGWSSIINGPHLTVTPDSLRTRDKYDAVLANNILECVVDDQATFNLVLNIANKEAVFTGHNIVAFGCHQDKAREYSPASLMRLLKGKSCEFWVTRNHDARVPTKVSLDQFLASSHPYYAVKVLRCPTSITPSN